MFNETRVQYVTKKRMDQDIMVKNDTKINDLAPVSNEKPFVNELRALIKDSTVLKLIKCSLLQN